MKADLQTTLAYRQSVAAFLEREGWRRDVAGEHDFALAAQGVAHLVMNPGAWLMLTGNVGTGKTFLAETVWKHIRRKKFRVDCSDDGQVDWLVGPADAAANGGVFNSAADELLEMDIFLDDLGSETLRNSYGNILDRCGKFIVKYHARGRGRLIVTTNLDGRALGERYGDRVFDRLVDRSVTVKFAGKSKRNRTIIK